MEIPKSKDERVLVFEGREGQGIAPITFELLEAGRELTDQIGGNLCCAVLGKEVDRLSKEMSQYADEVYSLDHSILADFNPEFTKKDEFPGLLEIRPSLFILKYYFPIFLRASSPL